MSDTAFLLSMIIGIATGVLAVLVTNFILDWLDK